MAMTPKMVKFVNEYLIDLNATQAAKRAGYSEDTAAKIGWENLQKPEIQAYMEVRRKEIADAAVISAEWVIQKLTEVVSKSSQGEPVLDREGYPTGEWKYDSMGVNKALDLIGKHLGMYTTKVDVTSKGESMAPPAAKLPDGTDIEI